MHYPKKLLLVTKIALDKPFGCTITTPRKYFNEKGNFMVFKPCQCLHNLFLFIDRRGVITSAQ